MDDITFKIDPHDQLISDLHQNLKKAKDELTHLTNPQKIKKKHKK